MQHVLAYSSRETVDVLQLEVVNSYNILGSDRLQIYEPHMHGKISGVVEDSLLTSRYHYGGVTNLLYGEIFKASNGWHVCEGE